jgi:hypothetical protein
MGWRLAPLAFTKFLRPVITAIREPSVINSAAHYLQIVANKFQFGTYFASVYLDDLIATCAGYA